MELLPGHADHVEAGGRVLWLRSDELDVGAVLQEAEVRPALDHLGHLARRLPALHRVIPAIRARGQEILGQGVIMLQQEPDPENCQAQDSAPTPGHVSVMSLSLYFVPPAEKQLVKVNFS